MTRIAIALVTLVAGQGTATWKDPDTVGGASPREIELAHVPHFFWCQRQTAGASPGELTMAATRSGCTITSGDGADTGVVRCYAIVRAHDIGP